MTMFHSEVFTTAKLYSQSILIPVNRRMHKEMYYINIYYILLFIIYNKILYIIYNNNNNILIVLYYLVIRKDERNLSVYASPENVCLP